MFFALCLVATALLFAAYKWIFADLEAPPLNVGNVDDVDIKKGFNERHVPKDVDTIVIGSGIGGLTTAAVLAKQGQKVLVLEQHDVAGGCTHTFEEKGFEFDVGLHYIGGDMPNTKRGLGALFAKLCSFPVEWASLGDVYDLAKFPSHTIPIRTGFKNLRKTLLAEFPEEAEAIDKYLNLVRETNNEYNRSFLWRILPRWLANMLKSSLWDYSLNYSNRTVQEVLDTITPNDKLQRAFTYIFGDYGLPPSRASWAIHCLVFAHYYKGAYYPVGGSSMIAKAMVPTIERFGGAVLVRAHVQRIVLEGGRATGVVVGKGKSEFFIPAKHIVSAAGALNTITRLLPPEAQKMWPEPFEWLQASEDKCASSTHLNVFVGLRGDGKELQLPKYNTWYSRKEGNLNEMMEEYYSNPGPIPDPPIVFVAFPSMKDPSYATRYPGKSACTMVTETPYALFEAWKDTTLRHRGADYDAIKENIKEQMLQVLYELQPQLEGRVEYCELGTPLTNNHYLNSVRGESYGLESSPERYSREWLRPDTPIPGLWLSGQDVFTPGVMGAMMGGYATAFAMDKRTILKYAPLL